jgi:hypothetical protein
MDSARTLMTRKTQKMTQHHQNTDLATTGKFLALWNQGNCLILYPAKSRNGLLCLSPPFTLVPCMVYSSVMKMEATCSSKTLVEFQWLAQDYIQKIELNFVLLTNNHHYQTRYICYFVDLPRSCHT